MFILPVLSAGAGRAGRDFGKSLNLSATQEREARLGDEVETMVTLEG